MEKFVIDGGVAAVRHGRAGRQQERRPAHPRRLGPDRGRGRRPQRPADRRRRRRCSRCSRRSASASTGSASTRSRSAPPTSTADAELDRALVRAHPRLLPARRPAAGPLRPRRHAAARRRRHRPPPPRSAPRRLPRARRRRSSTTATSSCARRGGLRAGDVFMDEPSVMATENALLAAALHARHDGHRQRRLRAARPGPRADAREDGRRHRGHRLQRADGQRQRRACTAASTRSAPTTSRSARSWRSPASTGGELRIKDTIPDDLRMIRLVFERLGLHSELDGDDVIVPGGQELRRRARRRRAQDQGPGRPVAGVPGRPDLDRGRARDAVRRARS